VRDKELQHILVPDYLKGIHLPNEQWEVLNYTLSWWKENCSFSGNDVFIRNTSHPFYALLKQDVSIRSFFIAYTLYEENKGKNYVIGKNLSKALFNTKTNVSCSRLPKTFHGFIYLPNLKDNDGEDLLGVFCNINQGELRLGFISKNVTIGFLSLELENDATVESIQIKNAYHQAIFDYDTKESLYTKTDISPKWEHLGILLNSIIYITNSDENLVEEVNQFSQKKNKVATEKKIYTSLPFVRVGFNFHLPKTFVYSVDSTLVRGHWRFQPCGPERAFIKHIYIEPHTRNFNEKII
jgi:hypothetical protein